MYLLAQKATGSRIITGTLQSTQVQKCALSTLCQRKQFSKIEKICLQSEAYLNAMAVAEKEKIVITRNSFPQVRDLAIVQRGEYKGKKVTQKSKL